MSGDINRVIIVGRLTRDAELRYTTSGTALTRLSLAVNRRIKQGDQWVDEANFFDSTLWGKKGESLNQYLTRGQQVVIEGELRQQAVICDQDKALKVLRAEVQELGTENRALNSIIKNLESKREGDQRACPTCRYRHVLSGKNDKCRTCYGDLGNYERELDEIALEQVR